jgi:hypothetical protein
MFVHIAAADYAGHVFMQQPSSAVELLLLLWNGLESVHQL